MTESKVSGKKSVLSAAKKAEKERTVLMTFIAAVGNLSWQMAVVVLVPIIGGFELDKYIGTSPTFVIVGFVIAMAGTFVIIKRALGAYTETGVKPSKETK